MVERHLIKVSGNIENSEGYRHAIDPFLLANFSKIKPGESIADLGTATGIIPVLLATTTDAEKITGVEIQAGLVGIAVQNIESNGLGEKVEIVESDIRTLSDCKILPHESYDVVISNPPYRKPGTGKVAPNQERASCRHELNGDIRDFLDAAFYLLRNRGRCYLIYLPERLPELLAVMLSRKLEPKRMRFVHSREGSPAVMVLVEGRRNGNPGLVVDPPLVIYDGDDYSPEVKAIFGVE